MRIRNAALEDAAAIARLNVLLAKESENVELDFRTVHKGVRTLLLDQRRGFYLVALENGAIVGQVMVTFEWSDWHDRNVWWLQSVYVEKPWRRKGVFKELFEELWVRATKEGVAKLRLYAHNANRKAVEVYKHLGMDRAPYGMYQMELTR